MEVSNADLNFWVVIAGVLFKKLGGNEIEISLEELNGINLHGSALVLVQVSPDMWKLRLTSPEEARQMAELYGVTDRGTTFQ